MLTQVGALLHRLTNATPPARPPRAAAPARKLGAKPSQPRKPEAASGYSIPADVPAAVVGTVTRIVDDVLVISDGDRRTTVRLQGVVLAEGDAHLRLLAEHRLRALIGKEVLAAGYHGTSGIEIVARVTDGEEDVNLRLVREGLARYDAADARALSQRDQNLYAQAERQARAARQGLWRTARR